MLFRARGFTGKVKASPKKNPRTLSTASLATRKRIERLIKRAREHQEKLEKKKKKKNAKNKKSKNNSSQVEHQVEIIEDVYDDEVENDEESGTFDGFEDEDEALLYPLANGWVMQRTPEANSKSYFTSFWSPEGQQYENVEDIRDYCKRERVKVDVSVFEKAMAKVVGENKK